MKLPDLFKFQQLKFIEYRVCVCSPSRLINNSNSLFCKTCSLLSNVSEAAVQIITII